MILMYNMPVQMLTGASGARKHKTQCKVSLSKRYRQKGVLLSVQSGGVEQLPDHAPHDGVHASTAHHDQHLLLRALWVPHLHHQPTPSPKHGTVICCTCIGQHHQPTCIISQAQILNIECSFALCAEDSPVEAACSVSEDICPACS